MFLFESINGIEYRYNYGKICEDLNNAQKHGKEDVAIGLLRTMCKEDLFFLMFFMLGMSFLHSKWGVARTYEVQDDHNRTLDLWPRFSYKSNLLTYGLVIQEILTNPEERICIFSYTRQIAKAFLRRIKVTLEQNVLLQAVFPDIFYNDPQRQSPKWNEDEGLTVKRNGKYLEATVEAWGITDGMPTSKHFSVRVYDDLVTIDNANTPGQIKKTEDCFNLSHALGEPGGQVRIIGTRYSFADLYGSLSKKKWKTRLYTAEVDGEPTLLTKEELVELKEDMGIYQFNAQMMLDPISVENQIFSGDWLKHYRTIPGRLNKVILVDPANEKKKWSDYTVMVCLGVDSLSNYYLLDMIRDRLNLTERWAKLKGFVEKWNCRTVGYEKYGMQADIEYFEEKMLDEGVIFDIIKTGGQLRKLDRISRLVPLFQNKRFLIPDVLIYKDIQGNKHDLIHEFITEEYTRHPFSVHDDMLDAISRCRDEEIDLIAPYSATPRMGRKTIGPLDTDDKHNYSWMGV